MVIREASPAHADDGAGQLLRRLAVGGHDQIVPPAIMIIDPIEDAVAVAVGGLARLDLAQPLRRRPPSRPVMRSARTSSLASRKTLSAGTPALSAM
jgi:hypothetical protein